MDGKYAMPSTGDIIDAEKKEIIARLKDETGTYVQSEKMVEVQFAGMNLLKAGDQFGIGRAISLAQVQVSKEPMHHNVFENAWVRVLDVHIPAGDTSLFHTHSTPSVFLVLSDTKTGSEVIMEPEKIPRLNDGHVWFEGFYDKPRVHRVWNSDTTEFHVIDMEILNKKYQAVDPPLNIPSLTLLFDENPVRGYRLKLDPQATLRISRRRAPIVLVKLTDAAGTVQANNKSFIKRGDYTFIQSGSDISFINTSNASQDLGLFELK
jgi:hypothetical protein